MSIKLNTSFGEAIDKLSILDIKKNKIVDDRKNDVIKEYNYLSKKLTVYLQKFEYYYKILYLTNLKIWNLMDIIRTNIDKNLFYKLCDETIYLNDSRFLIKKKINELCESNYKEQKGYAPKNLNIILNCSLEFVDILNGAIRYFSFYYDIINLYVNNCDYVNISTMFHDDKYIKINDILHTGDFNDDFIKIIDTNISFKFNHSYFNNKEQIMNNDNNYSSLINELYEKINLDVSIYSDYRN